MTTITAVLFWLTFYLPGYAPHTVVEVATLPPQTLGYATWCYGWRGCPYEKITIDLDQIQTYNNYLYGPWDRVVLTACIIAHEQVHIDTQSPDEYAPMTRQLDCLEHFEALFPTPGIEHMMRWPQAALRAMPKPQVWEAE